MKELTTALVLLVLIPSVALAQTYEVGLFMGVSGYQGDLVSKAYEAEDLNLAYGAVFRYNLYQSLSFKAGINKGRISGSDQNVEDDFHGHRSRNLSFESDILEFHVQAEYNLFGYNVLENIRQFSPYVLVGVSAFAFKPRAFYEGRWHELQPLGTEGQGMEGYEAPYKLRQISVPLGCGFKMSISDAVNLAFELGFRKTFTDYLDDVSGQYPDLNALQEARNETAVALSYRRPEVDPGAPIDPIGGARGNPDNKDWYFFNGFTLTFNIGQGVYNSRNFRSSPIPKGLPIF
ncbi:MAG: DUF6089 family protein [Bacteroidota bacterium]